MPCAAAFKVKPYVLPCARPKLLRAFKMLSVFSRMLMPVDDRLEAQAWSESCAGAVTAPCEPNCFLVLLMYKFSAKYVTFVLFCSCAQ